MKHETRRAWRELAYFSSLGFSVALSVFIGLGIGVLSGSVVRQLPLADDGLSGCWESPPVFATSGMAIQKSRKL
ncbi:MAG: F0F1 ATP synthase subunit [Desulfobacterales bacterium]|nr:F0F1 ATP synthase subunit [Desulfobacterales bacterium]